MTATANCELDGNTTATTFTLYGNVVNQVLNLAPNLVENQPED